MENYFKNYSKPTRVISDRGTAFTSKQFEEFLKLQGISHVLVATNAPRANGQVERLNRDIIPRISKLTTDTEHWDEIIPQVEFSINNSVNKSTGYTPSQLLFGINQVANIEGYVKNNLDCGNVEQCNLSLIREEAAEAIRKSQGYNKMYFDKKHKTTTHFQEGDLVMIPNHDVTVGVNKKLLPKFKGPYIIKKALPNDRYLLSDVEGYQITNRPFEGIFESGQMRFWN